MAGIKIIDEKSGVSVFFFLHLNCSVYMLLIQEKAVLISLIF